MSKPKIEQEQTDIPSSLSVDQVMVGEQLKCLLDIQKDLHLIAINLSISNAMKLGVIDHGAIAKFRAQFATLEW